MNHRTAALVLALLVASVAYAQPSRTFVASTGNDANPCSRTAPCRNFAAAVSAAAAGGEVIVLDSAGYGPVSITKAVSIIAPPGVYAGVAFPTTGFAISVNAPSATVRLRGLSLNGLLAGGNAIHAFDFSELHVERCDLIGFSTGVYDDRGGGGTLAIDDSVIADGGVGVWVVPAVGPLTATIERSRLSNNASGNVIIDARAVAGSSLTLRDSSMADASVGATAYAALMNVDNCLLTNLFAAVVSNNSAVVNVSRSTIVNNVTGLENQSGTLNTYGNNVLNGNGTATTGTITPVTTQ